MFVVHYKIRVLYKSGNAQEFWAADFTINSKQVHWTPAGAISRPVIIGFDEIEAVYQTNVRYKLKVWLSVKNAVFNYFIKKFV